MNPSTWEAIQPELAEGPAELPSFCKHVPAWAVLDELGVLHVLRRQNGSWRPGRIFYIIIPARLYFATCWFVTTGLEALCLFIPQQDSKNWYVCSRLVHLIRCSCVSTSQLKWSLCGFSGSELLKNWNWGVSTSWLGPVYLWEPPPSAAGLADTCCHVLM